MLELHYDGTKIIATLDGVSIEIKELRRDTGDWTLNVVKNHFDAFGVEYTESGVLYNKGATLDLYVMPDLDGSVSLGFDSKDTADWFDLEGFDNKVYDFFIALGAP